MKGFKFEPVRWATGVLALLVALAGVQELMGILPAKAQAGILIAIAVLTAVLGKLARDRTTAVAAPRDNDGRALVPVSYPSGGAAAQEIRTEQARARRYGTDPK